MGGLQRGGKGDPRRGGLPPWTCRVIGLSTCPQMGSISNQGIWNAQTKTWEGSAILRTMEGDGALGEPSLKAASCSTQHILGIATCLGRLVHFARDDDQR